jgi:hypothetical protein
VVLLVLLLVLLLLVLLLVLLLLLVLVWMVPFSCCRHHRHWPCTPHPWALHPRVLHRHRSLCPV